VCKDSKKESICALFFEKNMLYSQNFVFFEVMSLKSINFVSNNKQPIINV